MSVFALTEHDAPLEQMYGVHSEKDKAFWNGLQAIR